MARHQWRIAAPLNRFGVSSVAIVRYERIRAGIHLFESRLPAVTMRWHSDAIPTAQQGTQMPRAAAMPISGRPDSHRALRRGRRSFAVYY